MICWYDILDQKSMFKRLFIFLFVNSFLLPVYLSAQTGTIKGRLFDGINGTALSFGSIFLQDTQKGTYTDSLGRFELNGLQPGLYNLEARYGGYKTEVVYEIQVSNSKPYVLEIAMTEDAIETDSVVIVAAPFKQIEESPLSLQTIGTNEIKRYPGGNRDISRVIQALPGVSSTVSFRNDILIRGGGPNENRFYLDGIETPNINHFATQGASGGPVGLLNVDFIGEVDLYTGAFPSNRGNALSSVFEFKQRTPRDDRLGFTATVGTSDLALTMEGPTGENSSFMFSARRSYLQFLFRIFGLPFLPSYYDFQYRHNFKIGKRHELNIVGLGAIDDFALNLEADSTESQRYILNNIPVQTQWNYTMGLSYKYYGDQGFWTFVMSRNMINYNADKFLNNDENNRRLLDYNSQESENKLRLEYTGRVNGWKWNYGVNYEFDRYTTSTFQESRFGLIDYDSKLTFSRYGAFGQLSKTLFEDRLSLSVGMRVDGNSFSDNMRNPLQQFSPRFSASYAFTNQFRINFNTGIFYQLPPYTLLGFRDPATDELANLDIDYIRNRQVVGGLSYVTNTNTKFAIEGFYKRYDQYPFLLRDGVSLANLGGDFGVVGNEPAVSTSEGRAYGLEFLLQQRLYKGFYGIMAYTLSKSEFTNADGIFVPSAWDSRHIVSLTAGKKFKKNWEVGLRWRFQSATPFTPADVETSSLISVWDVRQREVPDYERINSERLQGFQQMDIRIDKKWFFKKWSLNLFLDVQNLYNYQIPGVPILNVRTDELQNPIISSTDPTRYETYILEDDLGLLQPAIGIIVEY